MHGDSEAGRLLLALDPDKYGSLSKGYSATEEEIEQVIMRAYGKQKIKGKEIGLDRQIGKMDDTMLENLVKYKGSPSALKNTDLYSRSRVYKIFKEEGAFDFTLGNQIEDLLDKYKSGLSNTLYSELKNALANTDEKTKRAALTTLVNRNINDEGMQALLTHSVFRKMETAALEEGNILGVYVNRTMVVGSTLNQFDEYMKLIENNAQISDKLKKILGKEIGQVSAETAIDTSVNYSSSRFRAEIKNQL